MSDAAPAFEGHGTKSYRAYVLLALTVVYTFNFVDRSLIGVTQEPLKHDLGIDDFQLGLLGGPAFAILYTLMGVPIARIAERRSRIAIVSIGAAVWSLMTAACGFAGNYVQLFAARIGVGIGEAACTPPSHSVIGDYFPSGKRATALAIYALGIPIGTMIAAIGGGWLVENGHQFFDWLAPTFSALGVTNHLGNPDQVAGWRSVFLILGLPGLLAALLLQITVKEPPRSGAATEAPSFGETLKELMRKPSFWHIAMAGALVSFVGYGTSQFLVSYAVRNYGVSISQASGALGLVAGISVAIGTFAGGFISDAFQKRRPTIACWLPGLGLLVALPIYLRSFGAPDFEDSFKYLLIAPVFHYLYLGPMYAVTQSVVQPRMRATAIAILLLVVNLIGYGLGPPLVGALSDFLAGQELTPSGLTIEACKGIGEHPAACGPAMAMGLRHAMMGAVAVLAWPMVHFFLAARTYLKDRVS
ncbi:MAG: MFS transporter [Terricaulis sp.]